VASLQGIYAIVNDGEHAVALTRAYLDGGVALVQYRAKHGIHGERLRALREMTRARDALLIVNDDWRAAMEYACDGVHLGPGDDGFDDPQRIRDETRTLVIGLSCGTVEEARAATPGVVDYIGVGPVYATGSKADAGEPIGIAGLKTVAAATRLPVTAIGGITLGNVDAVRASGVAMASIISALAEAPDPQAAAHMFCVRWHDTGQI
jgi:thiamine-phosphate pyrophosphorylase